MFDALLKHRAEFSRALRNFQFETMPDGRVLFAKQGAVVGGVFRHWVNGGEEQIDANVMMLTGLSDVLKTYFAQLAQHTAYYTVPFSNAADPPNTMTAATFDGVLDEFTNYTESTRPLWAKDAEASQSIANTTTPSRFTIGTGGGTVWGAALSTAQAKSANNGVLVCCSRFAAARVLLATDKLDIEYAITASDAG